MVKSMYDPFVNYIEMYENETYYILGYGYDKENKILRIAYRPRYPYKDDIKDYIGVSKKHWINICNDRQMATGIMDYLNKFIIDKHETHRVRGRFIRDNFYSARTIRRDWDYHHA